MLLYFVIVLWKKPNYLYPKPTLSQEWFLFCGTEELVGNQKGGRLCQNDTDKELSILNELYGYLRLYVNFFQPVRKLIKKERIGSKIIKRYDEAKTLYRRVLDSPDIEDKVEVRLRRECAMLNPAGMKRKITKLQNRLLKLNASKQKARDGKLRFIWSYSVFLIFYNLKSRTSFRKLGYLDSYREGVL